MKITEQQKEGISIIEVSGKLDTGNYSVFEEKLFGLIDKNNIQILLDCRELEYISSSGLRVLLMALKKLNALKGKFVLCNMQPEIHKVFKISGFTGIFENRDEALESF